MGVLVLQARGGRRVLVADIDGARLAFDEIERVSSDCLNEMRLMLDVLRIEDDPQNSGPPQRGMARLDDLISDFRGAGLRVDYEVRGNPVPLSTALDLSAFRITQEALTNVVQHAPGATASLTLTYEPEELAIEVRNDGPVVANVTAGHGLVGMQERVELFSGRLSWGPLSAGGFRVWATLPYAAVS
jgi:signal transduction histidine kinase